MSNSRSTPIRRFAAPITVAAFLAVASPALAMQPVGDPGDPGDPLPTNLPPVAHLTATPTDAIVSTLPELAQAKAKPVVQIGGGTSTVLYGDGDVVTLDASHSTDDHDEISKVSWDLDGDGTYEKSGTWADEKKESLRFFTVGDHVVRVKVEDTGGFTDTDKVTIHVRHAPHAVISSDNAAPLVGQDVKYSAAGSTADPTITDVAWDLDGDGTFETDTGTSLETHGSYSTPGNVTVQVRIRDAANATRTAAVVEHVNQAPTAAFTNSAAVAGQKVTFDASTSGDDQPIADYAWDLDGDGTFETDSGTTPTTTKTYATTGTVNVRLRVTDSLGATSIVTHPVVVGAAPKTTGAGTTAGGTTNTGGAAGPTGSTLSGKLAPVLTFGSKKLKLSSTGRVAIKLTCPKTATGCTGSVKLRTTAKHAKTLGTTRFTLTSGQTKTIRVLLPKAQRSAIRRAKHLKANAVVSVTDGGVTGVTTTGILIGL